MKQRSAGVTQPGRVAGMLAMFLGALGVNPEMIGKGVPKNAEDIERERERAARNMPWNNWVEATYNQRSRQQRRREEFQMQFAAVREKYGRGLQCFAYGGELTRKGARNIARAWAVAKRK